MPEVDPLLTPWPLDRKALEAIAGEIENILLAGGPECALWHDLTGSRSPFWPDEGSKAQLLTLEAQEELAGFARGLAILQRRTPPLPCAHGIQEGGLKYGPFPGFRDAPIHVRGSSERLGEVVPRHFPAALGGSEQPRIERGSGRLELAQWLASSENRLTARVLVNRLWQHHFGEGIVRTPSNFGALGERPTHPDLLGMLARRLIESDWSIKAMHRLIMLSASYQQSSRASAAALSRDPDNRLLSRMNRRRLDAEQIRDSLLALAGKLDERLGGPAERTQESPRRLIYQAVSRSERSDFGSLFNRANPALHVEKRTDSTVVPQALHLMNDAFVMDCAAELANRAEFTCENDADQRMHALYRLVLGRRATEDEVEQGKAFLEDAGASQPAEKPATRPLAGWAQYAQAVLLSNEFLFVD
jgi:hypothetical protein